MNNRLMNDSALLRLAIVFVCLLTGARQLCAQVATAPDVAISGREIQTFTENDENITVVLGTFELTFGDQSITGQDAVIWITTTTRDGEDVNIVHVYAEGGTDGVKAVDAAGNTTGDTTMFVVLETAGHVTAEGLQQSQQDASGMPLFRRATTARSDAGSDVTSSAISEAPGPRELIVIDTPPDSANTLGPRGSDDEIESVDVESRNSGSDNSSLPFEVVEAGSGDETATDRTPVRPSSEPTQLPAGVRGEEEVSATAAPITFYADKFESTLVDGKRVTIARGNVYIAQAPAGSAQYMELRAQEAVLFSEPLGDDGAPMPVKDTHSPMSMPLSSGQENVTGVYMKGDVVMSRGERYMTGPEAYYDFTTDRAIMTKGTFRTVQQERNVPIVARFDEARVLSSREIKMDGVQISTSEFYTPTYHFGAKSVYMMDMTPYDSQGEKLSQQHWMAEMEHSTLNMRGTPVMYMGNTRTDFRQGHTPLRTISVGVDAEYGASVETEWYFFRLMGLVKPKDVDAILHLDYKQGPTVGLEIDYERENYTGYAKLWGMYDTEDSDEFGQKNKQREDEDIRGRVLARHKQFMPRDWQMQFEVSYLSDRNYLRKYFPDEFYAGKDQETLVYARKQRDNWALDVLLKAKINNFLTQTWAAPEVGAYMIGEPILDGLFTFFGESHVGALQWDPADLSDRQKRRGMVEPDSSSWMGRFDTRAELDMPLHLGPVNVVPYVMGRVDAWTDSPEDGKDSRLYAQTGVRADMTFWKIYKDAKSRLLDVNGLRHSISPEAGFFIAGNDDVTPADLYPLSPEIEEHMTDLSGVEFGIRQLWETKRGEGAAQRNVDWMRLDITAGFFGNTDDAFDATTDGRYFASRPEYSLGDDFIYLDYEWYISDSTTLMADLNYDIDDTEVGRASIGLYMERSPRLSYFVGLRTIEQLSTAIGTFAVRYQINRKYSIALIEQYDFDYDGGTNLRSEVTFTRKFPRWYTSLKLGYDARFDDYTIMLNLWPEGLPEAKFGTGKQSVYSSQEN
jgi:hypothetical protein